jgi:hypothetical protein
MQAATPALIRRRREHTFYLGMTIAMVVTVFAGFAPTYYLRPYFIQSPLQPLLHLHGLIFTSWVVLFIVQTTLVAAKRVNTHRRLGIAGGVIASLMIIVGVTTAIIRASQGATPPGGPPPEVFLVVPLGDMLVFAILVGAGFYFRRQPDMHKRLMILATIGILAAAVARLPFSIMQAGPLAFFGLTDLFIVPVIIFDLVTLRRVHRATMLAAGLIIISQPLRMLIGGTGAWLAFATWLTSLAR